MNLIILLIRSACAGALLPQVDANGKELPICAECKCSHVARNTTLIKVSEEKSYLCGEDDDS